MVGVAALTSAASAQNSTPGATGAYTALTPTRLLDTRTSGQALGSAGRLSLAVAGVSGVPTSATAVALTVTVTNTTASSYLAVYAAGGSLPAVSNLNWTAGETVANLVIAPVGSDGEVTIHNHVGSTDVIVDLEGYFAPEAMGSTTGSYVPLTPARLDDGSVAANGSTTVQVSGGGGGVPASGVTAALVNITVTDTTASSYLTAYADGTNQPTASNLNWTAGETVANRAILPVSSSGQIELYNHSGSADAIVDVDGYFTDGTTSPANASLYAPVTPVRVLDTRGTGNTLGAGATLTQQLSGVDGISSAATAVVTNLTATNTTAASYLTVYPGGLGRWHQISIGRLVRL